MTDCLFYLVATFLPGGGWIFLGLNKSLIKDTKNVQLNEQL